MAAGAENSKMGLAEEAGWLVLLGGLLLQLTSGLFHGISNALASSSFFPSDGIWENRGWGLTYERTEKSDFVSFPNDILK